MSQFRFSVFMRVVAGLGLALAASCGDQAGITDAASPGQCSDGVDNDGDGLVDFPDDPGCVDAEDDSEDSAAMPACSDNRDNDGDGLIDFPLDPGCPVPQADNEADTCGTPGDASCPQCADGIDNDNNGTIDYPDDPGCTAAGDSNEFSDNSVACGQGLTVQQLPSSGVTTGTLVATSTSMVMSPCGGGNGTTAQAYVFQVTQNVVVVASTGDATTDFDTVLDLRSAMCSDPSSEIACNDDISTGNTASTITRAIGPGTYYLIVSAKVPGTLGTFSLDVDFFGGAGQPCTMTSECGPSLICRTPAGATQMICTGPVCSDGIDDDGDGKTDYPFDPGCATPDDDTEDDVCNVTPLDPACPKCSNGIDDDGDSLIDYPNDPNCVAASTIAESCLQSEPIIVATGPSTTGTTVGKVDDYDPPPGQFNGHACSSTSATASAPDVAIQLDLPAVTGLALRLTNSPSWDSAHVLLDGTCGGTPIECYDSPTGMVGLSVPAGRYYLIVDGWSTASGAFTLNVSGTIVNGESCESPLAQSGALVCGVGYACGGTVGARTCRPAECNDTIDNNGDGKIDFPADPGCTSPSDGTEETVCPGPMCPVCSDGLDNDGDTLIDYPTDTGCVSASGVSEGCRETDPILPITTPQTTGTLVGATDDHDPRCVTPNFPDRVYTLTLPAPLQTLVIDTENSVVDTVLSLMNDSCTEPSIACDDEGGVGAGDSLITRTNVAPGTYTIAVDSYTATLDTYFLNVKGTLFPGGSCEGPLFAAGVLECPAQFACNGPMGSRTCTPSQCLDGVDNNADGKVDYPADPGCSSPSDNTEDTVCPGAMCPQCADGMDNDSDGLTDFPADPACTSASGISEGCTDTDPILAVTQPAHTGTLVGATNDRQPQCVTTAGADQVWTLTIPALQSLSIDTEGSVVDTALVLAGADCGGPAIACDDDGGVGTGDSLITRSFISAGTYTISVDADSTTPNTYNLNVRGVIAPGGSCESPLFASGVLSCSVGFACAGMPGARTCATAECLDGIDNNGDGKIDYPFDPGCSSFSDGIEDTVCPGPACPVCSDGVDNDNDTLTDYPNDPSCISAAANNEACNSTEPVRPITAMITTGNTTGMTNDYTPTCGSSTHAAPDEYLQLDLPQMDSLTLATTGFDSAHALLNSTCGGTAIACSDPPIMNVMNVAAGTYYVAMDGWSTGNGEWSLTTTGVVSPGGSCEGDLFRAGAFTCSAGHGCAGAIGSRVCTPAACNDTMDNDGDGKTDFPADPGCTSINDTSETDACPGAGCPVCSNTVDDDMDGMTDYPADLRCTSAGFFLENFCPLEANIGGMISEAVTRGTLVGMADNFEQSCQANTGNDVSYGLELPVPVTELVIHTAGSAALNTVVSLWNGTCGTEIACDDDGAPGIDNRSLLRVPNLAAGSYAIQVDSFSTSNNGAFILSVHGTVAAGQACTSPLFDTGVLECAAGTTCTAGLCN